MLEGNLGKISIFLGLNLTGYFIVFYIDWISIKTRKEFIWDTEICWDRLDYIEVI